MHHTTDNIILFKKHKWLWQSIYWIFAALLFFFVFSNSRYDYNVRVLVVLTLTVMSFVLTQLINQFLIPKYLFKKRFLLFAYLVISAVIVSVWINILCIIVIIWYTATQKVGVVLPNYTDLILLISGSYIVILFAAFVHFIKETFERQMERDRVARQKAETELKLQEARLKLLQGQLHPHFLFNMLNNLYGLWIEKSNTTPDVILKLADLLDYMLYECDSDFVQLGKEIDFIKNYIDLELIRTDERLSVDIEMPELDNDLQIAPLILFVFVENAFKHGVHKNSGKSFVNIKIQIDLGEIVFTVSNNFIKADSIDSGLGLKNVIERLNLLYPNKYNLDIQSDNGIFSVALRIEIEKINEQSK
jgi:sensor histidine kinase YesM